MSARILILDDDRVFAAALARRLGPAAQTVATPIDAEALIAREAFDILLVDPGTIGLSRIAADWLRELKRKPAAPTAIAVTAAPYSVIDLSVVFDVIAKPIDFDQFDPTIKRALARRKLTASAPRSRPEAPLDGRSRLMHHALAVAEVVGKTHSTVLLVGESGTGKSRLARAIHEGSPRGAGPFVEVACGTLGDALLESELFGHVKGAFTDAHVDKPGRFALADGGTIFLDQMHVASPTLQAALLRVLEDGTFEPVGSTQSRRVDVRVVAASTSDLVELVERGRFRRDLFYRLNVVPIALPALRDRPGDIDLLADRLLSTISASAGRRVDGFTESARQAMRVHAWPGNVRELENAIERAVTFARGPLIDRPDLPEAIGRPAAASILPLQAARERGEREQIIAALDRNGWSRIAAARELGIDRTTLYKKMRKLGLHADAA